MIDLIAFCFWNVNHVGNGDTSTEALRVFYDATAVTPSHLQSLKNFQTQKTAEFAK